MFMGVVALRYQNHAARVVLTMECHNSDKDSRNTLTSLDCFADYSNFFFALLHSKTDKLFIGQC